MVDYAGTAILILDQAGETLSFAHMRGPASFSWELARDLRYSLADLRPAWDRLSRDEPIVICITGNGLKTPDVLQDRLGSDVTIRPSLSAFDRALADWKPKTVA